MKFEASGESRSSARQEKQSRAKLIDAEVTKGRHREYLKSASSSRVDVDSIRNEWLFILRRFGMTRDILRQKNSG